MRMLAGLISEWIILCILISINPSISSKTICQNYFGSVLLYIISFRLPSYFSMIKTKISSSSIRPLYWIRLLETLIAVTLSYSSFISGIFYLFYAFTILNTLTFFALLFSITYPRYTSASPPEFRYFSRHIPCAYKNYCTFSNSYYSKYLL